MADDNKPLKYMRYAVGEIVLVVIGILIALSINNWNESRKEGKFEQKVLVELQTSLQININYLKDALERNEQAIQSCELILKYIDSNLPYTDSLDLHFARSLFWFHPSLTNNAYEGLKSYGLHLITNDSIRNKLTSIYEWKFIERLSLRQEQYFYGTVAPLLTDWFESHDFFGEMTPLNYDELRLSTKYRHILNTMIANRKTQNQYFNRISRDRQDLIELIKKERKTD